MDGFKLVRSDTLMRKKIGILEQAKFLASESLVMVVSTSTSDEFTRRRKDYGRHNCTAPLA